MSPSTELEPVVHDAELVADGQEAGHDAVEVFRPSILPDWARSRSELLHAARGGSLRALRVVAFHGLRLPLYWLRLATRAPYGAARVAGVVYRWAGNQRGWEEAQQLAVTGTKRPEKVLEWHRATKRKRRAVVVGFAGLSAGSALMAYFLMPWQGWAVVALTVLPLLGVVGRVAGAKPIVDREHDLYSDAPRLTNDLVIKALLATGISALDKANKEALRAGDGDGFQILPPGVIRDEGDVGYRVEIVSPVPAAEIIAKVGRVAAVLQRPTECVWAEIGRHEGHLILRAMDKSMAELEQGSWPLLKRGVVSMFDPIPVATDYRGRTVYLTLIYILMIIGAMPRMGKTEFMRLLGCAAALDPTCQIDIYNLKGGRDFKPLAPICHRFRSGESDEDLGYVLDGMREMSADMRRRYQVMEGLDENECPESKTTALLARHRKLGLHPRLLLVDEVQVLYDHPVFGKEAQALVTDISKRGPACGIIVVQATQRIDAASIPKPISSSAAVRFCLKVDSHIENDLILGTSAYKNGYRACDFDFDRDKGVGILRKGGKPFPCRVFRVESAEIVKHIVPRALAARKADNRLTGYALGESEPDEPDTTTILDHLLAVWPNDASNEPKTRVTWAELAERLAEAFPLYARIDGDGVREASRLTSHQVKVRDESGKPLGRRGPAYADLVRVIAARDTESEHGGSDADAE